MNKRYKTEEKISLFSFGDEFEAEQNSLFMKNIIEDKGSKYSATFFKITDINQIKERFKELQKYKYYKKATHNTYAYRIKMPDTGVVE
jgi:putative IMPACT (imprinted ancient) family translation regulator